MESTNNASKTSAALGIADLQSRIAFQEDSLQALNKVVAEQDATILRLQKQVQHLNQKLDELAGSLEDKSGSEAPPPHY